jgi:hypothetical protein
MVKEDQLKPEIICQTLNARLGEVTPLQVLLATVRWTAKGNLVVTSGPNATLHTLQLAAPHIGAILTSAFKFPSSKHLPAAQPNIKWSKISINSVPTSVLNSCRAYTPAECHDTLKTTLLPFLPPPAFFGNTAWA